jgi:hypothetical protein
MTNEYNAFQNEQTTTFKKPEKRGTMLSLVAGLIVVLVLISLLAYRSGINIKQIRSEVAAFSAALKERYAEKGMDVHLEYEAVEAEGGIFHKTIHIKQPSLSVAGKGFSYVLGTSEVTIEPQDADFRDFNALLASPLTLKNGDQQRTVHYKTTAPVALQVTTNEAGMREYLMPLQKSSVVELTQNSLVSTYDIIMAETSFVAGAFSTDSVDDYTFSISLDDATVTHKTNNITFPRATYDFTASAEEGERTELSVEDLTTDYVPASLAPISLEMVEKRSLDSQTNDVLFEIERLVVNGNQFDVNVQGDIALKSAELLPLVKVHVTANGVDTVLKALGDANYFAPDIKRIIVSSLKRIAPEWNDASPAPLHFAVQRTATEPFMIGQVKADELLAIALKEWYISTETTPSTSPLTQEKPTEPALDGTVIPAEIKSPDASLLDDKSEVVKDAEDSTGMKEKQSKDSEGKIEESDENVTEKKELLVTDPLITAPAVNDAIEKAEEPDAVKDNVSSPNVTEETSPSKSTVKNSDDNVAE